MKMLASTTRTIIIKKDGVAAQRYIREIYTKSNNSLKQMGAYVVDEIESPAESFFFMHNSGGVSILGASMANDFNFKDSQIGADLFYDDFTGETTSDIFDVVYEFRHYDGIYLFRYQIEGYNFNSAYPDGMRFIKRYPSYSPYSEDDSFIPFAPRNNSIGILIFGRDSVSETYNKKSRITIRNYTDLQVKATVYYEHKINPQIIFAELVGDVVVTYS